MPFSHSIEIDGKIYTLRFSMAAYAALEKVSGKKFMEVMRALADVRSFGIEDIVHSFFAATRTAHPDLTLDAVRKLLDDQSPRVILEAVVTAMNEGRAPKEDGSPLAEAEERSF